VRVGVGLPELTIDLARAAGERKRRFGRHSDPAYEARRQSGAA